MLELAEDRRRFGSPRLHELLRREGLVQNHKRTERIYQEENLPIVTYAQGTSGPEAADQMLNTMGHSWFGQDD